jgi:hypothetical protein
VSLCGDLGLGKKMETSEDHKDPIVKVAEEVSPEIVSNIAIVEPPAAAATAAAVIEPVLSTTIPKTTSSGIDPRG